MFLFLAIIFISSVYPTICDVKMTAKMSFEEVMKDINGFVTVDNKLRSLYTNDFESIKIYMYNEMKKVDKAFEKIASSPTLGGSYADNLKVFKPDEFDLVIQLELPDQQLIIPEYEAGFVMLNISKLIKKIERERHNDELCRQLRELINENFYLVQAKFHHWMQSIVAKVVKDIPDSVLHINNKEYHIHHSIQGPAQTLEIEVEDRKFSIDFVPALRFPTSLWLVKRPCPVQGKTKHWIAVPKPMKLNKSVNDLNNLYWITSFVDQERYLIKNKNFLKPSIRLIKQLRDKHTITNLKSYYIKTVFLWIVVEKDEQKENDPNFWNGGLGNTFLYGYAELLKYAKSGNLPFFWDEEFNMLQKFSSTQTSDIYNQLNARYNEILKCKDGNPEKLYEIFLTKEQQKLLKERNAKITNGGLNSVSPEKQQFKPTESGESTPNKDSQSLRSDESQSPQIKPVSVIQEQPVSVIQEQGKLQSLRSEELKSTRTKEEQPVPVRQEQEISEHLHSEEQQCTRTKGQPFPVRKEQGKTCCIVM